jgi:hypothetical protein
MHFSGGMEYKLRGRIKARQESRDRIEWLQNWKVNSCPKTINLIILDK